MVACDQKKGKNTNSQPPNFWDDKVCSEGRGNRWMMMRNGDGSGHWAVGSTRRNVVLLIFCSMASATFKAPQGSQQSAGPKGVGRHASYPEAYQVSLCIFRLHLPAVRECSNSFAALCRSLLLCCCCARRLVVPHVHYGTGTGRSTGLRALDSSVEV